MAGQRACILQCLSCFHTLRIRENKSRTLQQNLQVLQYNSNYPQKQLCYLWIFCWLIVVFAVVCHVTVIIVVVVCYCFEIWCLRRQKTVIGVSFWVTMTSMRSNSRACNRMRCFHQNVFSTLSFWVDNVRPARTHSIACSRIHLHAREFICMLVEFELILVKNLLRYIYILGVYTLQVHCNCTTRSTV